MSSVHFCPLFSALKWQLYFPDCRIRQFSLRTTIHVQSSRARGDERPDSDWDLLILVNTKADLDYERIFRHKLFDLELELEQSFSVTVHNKNEWKLKHWLTPLYQNIAREGIRI